MRLFLCLVKVKLLYRVMGVLGGIQALDTGSGYLADVALFGSDLSTTGVNTVTGNRLEWSHVGCLGKEVQFLLTGTAEQSSLAFRS